MAQADVFYNFTNNPLVQIYFYYISILVVKILFLSAYTGFTRMRLRVFANPEDAKVNKGKVATNEGIERIRRAHLNDLENILPFIAISFGWILTNPSYTLALYLFRAYTLARLLHTLVYAVVVMPQPSRALSWLVGYVITIYMAISTLLYFW